MPEPTSTHPPHGAAGDGPPEVESYWMGGRRVVVHHASDDPQAPSFTESWLRAGQGPAMVVHRYSDFDYYLVSGSMDFMVDGVPSSAAPGDLVHVPRGTPHTYLVGPAGARVLQVSTPGYAWVDYVRALGVLATEPTLPPASFQPVPMDVVVRLARANGLEFVGERLPGASREGTPEEARGETGGAPPDRHHHDHADQESRRP